MGVFKISDVNKKLISKNSNKKKKMACVFNNYKIIKYFCISTIFNNAKIVLFKSLRNYCIRPVKGHFTLKSN